MTVNTALATATPASELETVKVRSAAMRIGGPLVGDLQTMIQAFSELSAAFAQMKLNGWDTVPRCKAACWLAHGWQVHPAVVMQRCWVYEPQPGKVVVEPQWDFVLDMLTARIPGFSLEVLQDDEKACEVRMSRPGFPPQTYRYTIEDARRQKLIGPENNPAEGKFNAWKGGSTREMLKAKAMRRCGDQIGGGVFSGLDPVEAPEAIERKPPSAAEVFGSGGGTPAFDAEIAEAPKALSTVIDNIWNAGKKMERASKLRVINAIYAQMHGLANGTVTFQKVDAISPGDSKQMLDWVRAKYPGEKRIADDPITVDGAGAAGATPAAGTDAQPAPPPPAQEAAPEEESVPLEEPADPVAEAGRAAVDDLDGNVDTIFLLAGKAKKMPAPVKGRTFVKEVAEGSGKWFFTDLEIGKLLGFKSAPKIRQNGTQAIDEATCRQIVREMRKLGIE